MTIRQVRRFARILVEIVELRPRGVAELDVGVCIPLRTFARRDVLPGAFSDRQPAGPLLDDMVAPARRLAEQRRENVAAVGSLGRDRRLFCQGGQRDEEIDL